MNDDDKVDTLYGGQYVWNKEPNGTYTCTLSIYYKNGRCDNHIMEDGVSEKEYFRRKLDGTA